MEAGNLMINGETFETNYMGRWIGITTENTIVQYIDSKINEYLDQIEKNRKYLIEYPRSNKAYMQQNIVIFKAKIEALREIKNYIKVLEEEK